MTGKEMALVGLLLAVLAVFVIYFVIYLAYAKSLFAFPFDFDQGEGFELNDAILLARGQGIYLDNSIYPFYSGNYPPVYRLMLVPLIWLFGPHIWVGRVLTFGTSLACGLLIFYAVWSAWPMADRRARPAPFLVSAICALAFFSSNYVYWIGPLARAHIPMVMFSLAGAICIGRGKAFGEPARVNYLADSPNALPLQTTRWYLIGFALLMLAGWTKLQAVDVIVAGFVFALIQNPRLFAKALLACGLITGAGVLALNALTGGQFWLNVVSANVNEYDINRTWAFYGEWFRLHTGLIAFGVALTLWDIARAIRQKSLKELSIWSLWFVASVGIVGMLTGKWGAGPTYLISAVACACVCAGRLVMAFLSPPTPPTRRGVQAVPRLPSPVFLGFAALMLWQATLTVHLPTSGRVFGALARVMGIPPGASSYPPYPYVDSVGYTQLGHLLDAADTANGWRLAQIARESPGPVWSEEAMIAINAGKEVVTNPTQLLNLSKNNTLDTSRMIDMINRRIFGRVIFRAQFYPNDVLIAIGQNYAWCETVRMNGFDYQVLCPR